LEDPGRARVEDLALGESGQGGDRIPVIDAIEYASRTRNELPSQAFTVRFPGPRMLDDTDQVAAHP